MEEDDENLVDASRGVGTAPVILEGAIGDGEQPEEEIDAPSRPDQESTTRCPVNFFFIPIKSEIDSSNNNHLDPWMWMKSRIRLLQQEGRKPRLDLDVEARLSLVR